MPFAPTLKQKIELEVEECADTILLDLIGRKVRRENWHLWYLCERHGGAPLIASSLQLGQIAFWDGEDIIVDGGAPFSEVIAALPEELTHRLCYASERFETLNYQLQYAREMPRNELQELVGQRVAAIYQTRKSRLEIEGDREFEGE